MIQRALLTVALLYLIVIAAYAALSVGVAPDGFAALAWFLGVGFFGIGAFGAYLIAVVWRV